MKRLVFLTSIATLTCGVAEAANSYFNARDGYASEPANWSTGALPTSSDVICMTNVGQNVMRVREGDSLSAQKFYLCRNSPGEWIDNVQVVRQTGGTVTLSSEGCSQFAVWEADNSKYFLSGGLLSFSGSSDVVQFSGRGIGVVNVDGGELRIDGGWSRISAWGGRGALDVRGGVVNVRNGNFHIAGREGAHSILNIGGAGRMDLHDRDLGATADTAEPTCLLNLTWGGTLSCGRLTNDKGATTCYSLAGGTLEPNMQDASRDGFVTGVDLRVNAGGARIDAKNKHLTLASTLNRGNLRKENLYRRWSFTDGSLVDSVGGVTATAVGGLTFADGRVSLPGGVADTAYVNLQGDGALLPADCANGFTIEMWAQADALSDYACVFRMLKPGQDTIFLRWNKGASTGSEQSEGGVYAGGELAQRDNPISRWTLGEMCYLAMVFEKSPGGGWTCSINRFDARNGVRYADASMALPASFDPTVYGGGADFSLGRSHDSRNDATATYDEVRIWRRPLTRSEMSASAAMGPNADFEDATGLEKSGEGALVLTGVNAYEGKTLVRNGQLALGAKPFLPHHRWSFNGTLADSAGWAGVTPREAKKLGENAAAIELTDECITLPGGSCGSAYVRLTDRWEGMYDKNTDKGVTYEFWVRENAVASWARIFTISATTWCQHFMTWTVGTETGSVCTAASTSEAPETAFGSELANFETGVWYHVAMTAWKDDGGTWKVTFWKHEASTGRLLGSRTHTPSSGWSPAEHLDITEFVLGHSVSGDPDASASYDEVRIWNRALTADELSYSAKLGPDTLPAFGVTAAEPAALPSATELELAAEATLDLCGAEQTVRKVSGNGQLAGSGTLTATDGIFPGTDGTVGCLKVTGGAKLVGSVSFDCLPDGTCDSLVLAPNATYDVSAVKLTVKDLRQLRCGMKYRLVETSGAACVGSFDTSELPDSVRVTVTSDGVTARLVGGLRVIVR